VTETIRSSATVYVAEPAGNLTFRPSQIGLGVGDYVKRIRWQTYGGAVASGTGLRPNGSCTTTCPFGQHRWLRVTVELSQLGVCRGVFVYRHLRLDGTTTRLAGLTGAGCTTT
jgi:hypothetical protein